MAKWTVQHKYKDTVLDTFKPLNLNFTLVIDEADDISYDISLAEPTMRWTLVGAKRTDYYLYRDGQLITAGFHSYTGSTKGSELLNIQGKSWLWYLQNRHYPFNPSHATDFLGGTATEKMGLGYQNFATPGKIITDIMTKTLSRPNSLGITGYSSLPAAGPKMGFSIPLGDTESIYDKIKQLSDMTTSGEGDDGGFNFDVLANKQFKMWVPSRFPNAARSSPSGCIYNFNQHTHTVPTDMVTAEFQNNGPDFTHLFAEGAGTSEKYRGYALSPDDETQEIFRRWDGNISFSDVKDPKRLMTLAQMHLSAGLYPQISVPLTVKPDNIPGFWTKFQPGEAVWIDLDMGGRRIDGGYKINQMRCTVDAEGNETVDLDTQSIMPLGRPGMIEG
jgi:hypothetical protein